LDTSCTLMWSLFLFFCLSLWGSYTALHTFCTFLKIPNGGNHNISKKNRQHNDLQKKGQKDKTYI
jgi:hypothetical protein